jgi:hypothetical protein
MQVVRARYLSDIACYSLASEANNHAPVLVGAEVGPERAESCALGPTSRIRTRGCHAQIGVRGIEHHQSAPRIWLSESAGSGLESLAAHPYSRRVFPPGTARSVASLHQA